MDKSSSKKAFFATPLGSVAKLGQAVNKQLRGFPGASAQGT